MVDFPTLGDEEIERLVGARNLRKGWEYFRDGAVTDTYRQERTLRGCCQGSGSTPYRVHAMLDDHGIAESSCTCPVGLSGDCKHIAALLVAWQQRRGKAAGGGH